MKTAFLCAVAAVAALLAPIGIVQAEDIRFVNAGEGESCPDECLKDCGCGPMAGLEGGIDVTLLSLYSNHGAGECNGGNSWFDDASGSPVNMRFWLGYRGEDGLGIRAAYWSYFSDFANGENFFDVREIDIEATVSACLGKWEFEGFAGVRFGDFKWSDENGAPGYFFSGAGPTLGVDVRRALVGNLSLVAGVRGSVLYGRTRELDLPDTSIGVANYVTETRIGVDYRRQMRTGGYLVLGVAWENHCYNSLSGNVDNDIDPEDLDVTLAGPVFRFSIVR